MVGPLQSGAPALQFGPPVLQFGVPGGGELFVVFLLLLVPVVLVGRWIYRDAARRGSEWAWQWGVGVSLLFLAGLVPGLLGVVIYLLVRDDVDTSVTEPVG